MADVPQCENRVSCPSRSSIPKPCRGIAGPNLRPAVVAAGKHLTKLFEGWIVATPGRRKFAVRITSYPELDISVMFDWNAMAADVTERVRAAMDD
jgi:hypothetical protein